MLGLQLFNLVFMKDISKFLHLNRIFSASDGFNKWKQLDVETFMESGKTKEGTVEQKLKSFLGSVMMVRVVISSRGTHNPGKLRKNNQLFLSKAGWSLKLKIEYRQYILCGDVGDIKSIVTCNLHLWTSGIEASDMKWDFKRNKAWNCLMKHKKKKAKRK